MFTCLSCEQLVPFSEEGWAFAVSVRESALPARSSYALSMMVPIKRRTASVTLLLKQLAWVESRGLVALTPAHCCEHVLAAALISFSMFWARCANRRGSMAAMSWARRANVGGCCIGASFAGIGSCLEALPAARHSSSVLSAAVLLLSTSICKHFSCKQLSLFLLSLTTSVIPAYTSIVEFVCTASFLPRCFFYIVLVCCSCISSFLLLSRLSERKKAAQEGQHASPSSAPCPTRSPSAQSTHALLPRWVLAAEIRRRCCQTRTPGCFPARLVLPTR